MFPFFSFYFEAWARVIPELQKIVSMVLPNQTLKSRLGTEAVCYCPAPCGKCHYSAKSPEMTCSLGERNVSRCAFIYHMHFPKQKAVLQSPWNFSNIKKEGYILTIHTPSPFLLMQKGVIKICWQLQKLILSENYQNGPSLIINKVNCVSHQLILKFWFYHFSLTQ